MHDVKREAEAARWFLWAFILVLAGCTGAVVETTGTLQPLPPIAKANARHYVVDAGDSRIVFLVYRGGPLAALGHNHVIRATTFSGDVYINDVLSESAFSLTLPVSAFEVDNPRDRDNQGPGFASHASKADIDATTHNMKTPGVLDAGRYPDVFVRSVSVAGTPQAPILAFRVDLRGASVDMKVPLTVIERNDRKLVVAGNFTVRQSAFGITPFSIMGGGIKVLDDVKVQFQIVADRS